MGIHTATFEMQGPLLKTQLLLDDPYWLIGTIVTNDGTVLFVEGPKVPGMLLHGALQSCQTNKRDCGENDQGT